jgi:hypothetical protein
MSKTVMLNDEAYSRLSKAKRKNESFSEVVLRFAPQPPILTCGELLEALEASSDPIIPPAEIAYLRRKKSSPIRSRRPAKRDRH